MRAWKPGQRLRHRYNADLGPGKVVSVEGRVLVVEFPDARTTLRLAADADSLLALEFPPGSLARRLDTGDRVLVVRARADGGLILADGSVVDAAALWPVDVGDSPMDRLAQGDVGAVEAFSLRLDALHLAALREADGLGSFLGGRIRLFPHQLHVAERATRSDPVRWLLADEVGLGKTVEACLILQHLLRTRRADRALVVAPRTLTVQWLGELWRKYHQVFVLLDDRRVADVEKDFGPGFSPFDAHRRAVVALETLIERPRLVEQAAASAVDVLVVDEAHRLRRPAGHPGDPSYRAVAPLTAAARHVLLLSATPLEEDAQGFFRLLQLLRPETWPEDDGLEDRLARAEPLPPCTSSTRRADIGGLPPRVGCPVDLPTGASEEARLEMERAVLSTPAANAVAGRIKADLVRRALASGAALVAALGARSGPAAPLASCALRASESDARLDWLAVRAREWRERGEKTLIFVAERETLEEVRTALSRRAQLRCAVFHEDLPASQGDIEVAQFRLAGGPSVLVTTECGGEGRNFEFCKRVVLFDLPWNPAVVEQRIGRLDRIGRQEPVEIVYFRPPGGFGRAVALLYERLGLFREPLGGIERELAAVEAAIIEAALGDGTFAAGGTEGAVAAARDALGRTREAAYRELHRDPFRPERAAEILARVPSILEDLTQEVVLAACEMLGLHVEEQRGGSRFAVEFGARARIDSLPGVPGGSTFLGTFDRREAVEDESIDFFASGHPFVEGILAEIEDGPWGRTAILTVDARGEPGLGLVALYKDGPVFEAKAVDAAGAPRPEWAAAIARRPLRTRRVDSAPVIGQAGWPDLVRRLAAALGDPRVPDAVAFLLVGSGAAARS